jgi:8-oxo-dGTP pyrophosphatase MutT (NUDIX family)
MWDLPKGKIDEGEKKRMAALREVREETGVKKLSILKKLLKTYHTYKTSEAKILKVTHWYLMMSDANGKLVPQISESIEQAEWISRNEIEERLKNTFPSIRDVIQTAMPAMYPG